MKIRRALVALLLPIGLLLASPTQTAEPVVVLAAGDIAHCARPGDEATAALLDANPHDVVLALGDLAYEDGTTQQFADCYGPTWGRHKTRTRPVPGNHEYHTSGAAPYYSYFGAAAGAPGQGYYSYNLSSWHLIALNSEISASATSPQIVWLKADLAANPAVCTLAYWHKARWSSGYHGNSTKMAPAYQVLFDAGADVVLVGHDHDYERFAPQNPSGQAATTGIRQFVVGTGGKSLTAFKTVAPNSEARNAASFGVLKLTLHPGSYDWTFLPAAGSYTDSGSASCVGAPAQTPTPTPIPNTPTAIPTATPIVTPTVTMTPTATLTPTMTVAPTATVAPTITPAPSSTPTPTLPITTTFLPVADARVQEANPNSNYGTSTNLSYDQGAGAAIASYIRFSLPITPTRAILRLRATTNASVLGPAVYRAGDGWAETTLTWTNRPATVGAPVAAFGAVTASAWHEIDVTGAVQVGQFTLALIAQSTDGGSFSSRESADKPQLIITP